MTLTPLRNRALLRPIPHALSATIAMPETIDEPDVIHAKVITLGPRDKGSWDIKVGDTVITTEYMGAEVTIERSISPGLPTFQQRHLIMREKDILAVVQNDEADRLDEAKPRSRPE